MAKGNIGNLLQHFVAVHAMKRLAEASPDGVQYIDLFAMAPWEPLELKDEQFFQIIQALGGRSDDVASALRNAEIERGVPLTQEYPNTLVLARQAGINLISATLCEKKESKRDELRAYLVREMPTLSYHIHNTWSKSLAALVEPAFVIMDPNRVLPDRGGEVEDNCISVGHVRSVLGSHQLNILSRPGIPGSLPCVVTIFSYGQYDYQASQVDKNLRELFKDRGWCVQRIAEPTKMRGQRSLAQAWWCASHEQVAAPL